MNPDILRYGILGASYLISSLSGKELESLDSVILFGSVAAGTAEQDSDIDIFFDIEASRSFQNALRAKLNKAADSFYLTRAGLDFKMKSVNNEFSILVGRLSDWKDLAQSISSSGITLYGKYLAKPPGLKAYTILSWESLDRAKGSILNSFYGYRAGRKKYPGLLEKSSGTKLGRATIMIPSGKRDRFIKILEKHKISYSRRDVWG